MMKNTTFRIFIILFTMAITCGSLFAEERMTVAILDLTPKGVPAIVSGAVSDIMRSEFSNFANFTVVERKQIKEILDEQGFQMTGCTDASCAVRAGRLLSARRIVTGEVTALGKKIIITVRYLDVEKGVSLFSEKGIGESIDVIDITASDVARRFAQRIVGGDMEVLTRKSPIIYYTMGLVPGLGQFYSGRIGKGITFACLGAAAGAGVFLMYQDFQSKSDAYHALGRGSSEYDSSFNEYKTAVDYYNYSLVIFGAVYLAHWIDMVFFSRPDFSGGAKENAMNDTFIDYRCYMRQTMYDTEHVYALSVGYRF